MYAKRFVYMQKCIKTALTASYLYLCWLIKKYSYEDKASDTGRILEDPVKRVLLQYS